MLFCDRLSERELLEARAADREGMLEMLLNDFRKAFPDLTFELHLDFTIVNAQAMTLQDGPTVTIYGGLALHPDWERNCSHSYFFTKSDIISPKVAVGTRPFFGMRMRIGPLGCNGRNG